MRGGSQPRGRGTSAGLPSVQCQPGEVIHREVKGSDVFGHPLNGEKALHITVVGHEVQHREVEVLIPVVLGEEPGVYPVIRDALHSTGVSGPFVCIDKSRHVGAVGSFHISCVGT